MWAWMSNNCDKPAHRVHEMKAMITWHGLHTRLLKTFVPGPYALALKHVMPTCPHGVHEPLAPMADVYARVPSIQSAMHNLVGRHRLELRQEEELLRRTCITGLIRTTLTLTPRIGQDASIEQATSYKP